MSIEEKRKEAIHLAADALGDGFLKSGGGDGWHWYCTECEGAMRGSGHIETCLIGRAVKTINEVIELEREE